MFNSNNKSDMKDFTKSKIESPTMVVINKTKKDNKPFYYKFKK